MSRNSGIDRQREHQANERTFLAWLRTSVSLIALGLATARFGIFLRQIGLTVTQESLREHPWFNSETLGLILVLFGLVIIGLAGWRYSQVFWQIERGQYRPTQLLVWLMTGMVMILGALSAIPLLLWRNQNIPSAPIEPHSNKISRIEKQDYFDRR